MKCGIFYSWQSDLPNKDNRSFIEDCIKKSIDAIAKEFAVGLTLSFDKDTKGTCGTPDISEIIFEKIAKSDVFICDISIINSGYDGRKTPNPNVLLELGYAARTLGWDKIICLYNLKYGAIEDVPFDLDHRRIFAYNSAVENEKVSVVKGLSDAIKLMYSKGYLHNPLKGHMKGKIDYCILELLKQLNCILLGATTMTEALSQTNKLLDLEKEEIMHLLESSKGILGFFAHNDLSETRIKLDSIFLALTSSNIYPVDWSIVVLDAIDLIRQYQYLISDRAKNSLYKSVLAPNSHLKVVSAHKMNPDNPRNTFLLLKKVGKDAGKVLYSGAMPYVEEKHLLSPHYLNAGACATFADCIFRIINLSNKWLDENGSEFILDPDFYGVV